MSVLGILHWLRFFIVVLLLLALHENFVAEAKRFHSIAGPFDILVRRVDDCLFKIESKENIKIEIHEVASQHKNNRLAPLLRGNGTYHAYINDNLDARATIASWSNVAGWRENAHVVNAKGLCRSVNLWFPNLWRELRMNTFGEDVDCPFYPGYARFENLTFAWKHLPIKTFFYGRWRLDLILLNRKEETVGCVRLYGDTIPKV